MFAEVIRRGGVAVFPADTVYGLACDPDDAIAVRRVYELKGRPPEKPAAVMFFTRDAAFEALPEIGPRTRALLTRLMPGGITALLANPEGRFPLACGPDPSTLGLRVVEVAALGPVDVAVMQTSANLSGGPDPCRLADVPQSLREGADLVVDGGELPGTSSTVVDLRGFEPTGEWTIVRQGAVPADVIGRATI